MSSPVAGSNAGAAGSITFRAGCRRLRAPAPTTFRAKCGRVLHIHGDGGPTPTITNAAFTGCTPSTLPGTLTFQHQVTDLPDHRDPDGDSDIHALHHRNQHGRDGTQNGPDGVDECDWDIDHLGRALRQRHQVGEVPSDRRNGRSPLPHRGGNQPRSIWASADGMAHRRPGSLPRCRADTRQPVLARGCGRDTTSQSRRTQLATPPPGSSPSIRVARRRLEATSCHTNGKCTARRGSHPDDDDGWPRSPLPPLSTHRDGPAPANTLTLTTAHTFTLVASGKVSYGSSQGDAFAIAYRSPCRPRGPRRTPPVWKQSGTAKQWAWVSTAFT